MAIPKVNLRKRMGKKGISYFIDFTLNGKRHRLTVGSNKKTSKEVQYDELMLIRNFEESEYFRISNIKSGHGGGDKRMLDKLFKDPNQSDPLSQSAGTRDGCMSILTGIVARKSIDSGKPVFISDLTDLETFEKRPN
jgi:hypothetical protein